MANQNLSIIAGNDDKFYAIELGRDNSYSDYNLNKNTEITNPKAVEILKDSDLSKFSRTSSEWFEKFGKEGQEPKTAEEAQQMTDGLAVTSKATSKQMDEERRNKEAVELAAKNEAINEALAKASGQVPSSRGEKKEGHKNLNDTDDYNKIFQKNEDQMYVGYVKEGAEAQAGYTAYFEKAKSTVYESGLDNNLNPKITREYKHGNATHKEDAKKLTAGEAAKLALKQTMNDMIGR